MHVVVIEHLTPELIRRPDFLTHPNSCIGVNSISGVIYDKHRVAARMRALLGEGAVTEDVDGVRVVLASGQRLELLLPAEYERCYGHIAESPEPETPRLGVMTLRVASIEALRDALEQNRVDYGEEAHSALRVQPEHACGATLLFTESPPH